MAPRAPLGSKPRRSPQFGKFAIKSTGKDRETAQGFGIEVLIVEMKAGGIAFPLPLIAAPEPEEPLGPGS